jgi:glycine hydroxymethyltransferase
LRVFGLLARDTLDDELQADESQGVIVQELDDAPWAINVQPLSGGPANTAVYIGFLRAGDTMLAMDLAAGGHLSHGHKMNFSGQNYTIVSYGVNATMDGLDYDDILHKALTTKPAIIVAGYSAFVGMIEWSRFADIADAVQATHGYRPILMADIAHIAGLIAG